MSRTQQLTLLLSKKKKKKSTWQSATRGEKQDQKTAAAKSYQHDANIMPRYKKNGQKKRIDPNGSIMPREGGQSESEDTTKRKKKKEKKTE